MSRPARQVRDVMTRNPITVDPEAPVGTAVAVMRDRAIHHLPVVDEAGRLVGIVTDRDLRSAAFAPAIAGQLSVSAQRRLRGLARLLENVPVREVMTRDVVTTEPGATLAEAAAAMCARRVGSLPVVEGGKLVGMLTERDLLRALGGEGAGLDPDLEAFLL